MNVQKGRDIESIKIDRAQVLIDRLRASVREKHDQQKNRIFWSINPGLDGIIQTVVPSTCADTE